MEDIEIYENYFNRKYKVINNILEYYHSNEKIIAVWGAGLRGNAFLNIFDPFNEKIDYVFDKDKSRYGEILKNGHKITDFLEYDADIVVVANNALEYVVLRTLRENGKKALVLNIDNIILGDLTEDEVICPKEKNLTKVREIKIGAVVVVYNPDASVVDNIKTYANDLEIVYVHDNSEIKNKVFEKELKKFSNVIYNFPGENQGLCVPFNKFYNMAVKQGIDWMITFDQDSAASAGMIGKMRVFAESAECKDTIGIISPTVNELDNSGIKQDSLYTYYDVVIQSGAMHRISMMGQVGSYNEDLFIDMVDYDYCVRCRAKGYYIVRLNNAVLLHNQSDNDVKKRFLEGKILYIGKFSPDRYYYKYRNILYSYYKYHQIDPIYGLDCLNILKKLKMGLEYDTDFEIKKRAMEMAEKDFKECKMGKWTGL